MVEQYSRSLSVLHWAIGGGIVGAVACVKVAQNMEDKEWKSRLMTTHKSLALIVLALVPLRVGARFYSHIPKALAGASYQHTAATWSHRALYGLMLSLPVSGVAMGYFSGFGVPFFGIKKAVPGSSTPDKEVAGMAYKAHSYMGQALVWILPLHVGASIMHAWRGQKIFRRISPFPRN